MNCTLFHPPPGWREFLTETVEALEALDITVTQVKSKFGHLCVYTEGHRNDDHALIQVAELWCSQHCEMCGEYGAHTTRTPNGIVVTLCGTHAWPAY